MNARSIQTAGRCDSASLFIYEKSDKECGLVRLFVLNLIGAASAWPDFRPWTFSPWQSARDFPFIFIIGQYMSNEEEYFSEFISS
jgi:hypothetical protein